MYNQNYGDYMNPVDYGRGISEMYNMPNNMDMNMTNMTNTTYDMPDYYMKNKDMMTKDMMNEDIMQMDTDLEKLYPETYKLLNPMVMKACQENTKEITKKTIDDMARTICEHFEVEANVEINVKQNLRNGDVVNPRSKQYMGATTKETRRYHNNYLHDMVKILLITNLIKKSGHHHMYPPVEPIPKPPHYMRPPYYRDTQIDQQINQDDMYFLRM